MCAVAFVGGPKCKGWLYNVRMRTHVVPSCTLAQLVKCTACIAAQTYSRYSLSNVQQRHILDNCVGGHCSWAFKTLNALSATWPVAALSATPPPFHRMLIPHIGPCRRDEAMDFLQQYMKRHTWYKQYMERPTWYEEYKAQGLRLRGNHLQANMYSRKLREYWNWSLATAKREGRALDAVKAGRSAGGCALTDV